jgi:hypothetical protein
VDEAVVNGGALSYTQGPDFAVNSTFTMNGGSWVQVGVGNWIDFGIGAGKTGVMVLAAGAIFDSGSAGNLFLGRGNGQGLVTINGGTFIVTNVSNVELHMQGAGSRLNLNGGVIHAGFVSFDGDNDCLLQISTGELRIARGDFFQGIWKSSDAHVNFVTTNGSIFIDHITTATMGDLLSNGKIQYNNVVDTNVVKAVDEGTGIRITASTSSSPASPAPPPTGLQAHLSGGVLTLTITNLTLNTTNIISRTADLPGAVWSPVYEFVAQGAVSNYMEPAANAAAIYRVTSE